MEKYFTPLDSTESPCDDPFQIATWQQPDYSYVLKDTIKPPDKTKRSYKKHLNFRLEPFATGCETVKSFKKIVKTKCYLHDKYEECVKSRRTIDQLRRHGDAREDLARYKEDKSKCIHAFGDGRIRRKMSLIKFDSPILTADVRPKLASPSPSVTYTPINKLLRLKRLRSGNFINESRTEFESHHAVEDNLHELSDEIQKPHKSNDSESKQKLYEITSDIKLSFKPVIMFGSKCVNKDDRINPRRPKEVSCIFTAFCYSYAVSELDWNEKSIDEIVEIGEKLYEHSTTCSYETEGCDFDIIPHVCVHDINITARILPTSKCGLLNSPSGNVYESLANIFEDCEYRKCMLQCEDLFVLLWKRCKKFYIFDPSGRRNDCQRSVGEDEKAALISVKYIEHLIHIVVNLSGLGEDSFFKLYELKLEDIGGPSVEITPIKQKKAHRNYQIVNDHYAIIRGSIGLTSPNLSSLNPSLMTSYIALIYGQIESARYWTKQLIDQLVKFTLPLFVKYTVEKGIKNMLPKHLPEQMKIGNYFSVCEFTFFYISAHVYQCESYEMSPLTSALTNFFKIHTTGLIQIDKSALSLWHDGKFYYAFDPFKRSANGSVLKDDDEGAACLQIHLNVQSLCRMIYSIASEVKFEGNFFIHTIVVKKIETHPTNLRDRQSNQHFPLAIQFPVDCEEIFCPKERIVCEETPEVFPPKGTIPQKCLSLLSVSPCARTCSESDVYEAERKKKRTKKKIDRLVDAQESLPSLSSFLRFPGFTPYEVAHSVLLSIVEGVVNNCVPDVSSKKENEKIVTIARMHPVDSNQDHVSQTKKSLNATERLQMFEKPENYYKVLTLEEELKLPSNFQCLPDGSWIILGKHRLTFSQDISHILGILSSMMAIVLSKKYKISTWSDNLVDYNIELAEKLSQLPDMNNMNRVINWLLNESLPDLHLGTKAYKVSLKKLRSGRFTNLLSVMRNVLEDVDSVLILMNSFACSLLKKNNFYYLFVGYPCDRIGFRQKEYDETGNPCLIRFMKLQDVIRRIDSNRGGCDDDQSIVVMEVCAEEVRTSDNAEFVERSPSQEEEIYQKELRELKSQKTSVSDKSKPIAENQGLDYRKDEGQTEDSTTSSEHEAGPDKLEVEEVPFKHIPKLHSPLIKEQIVPPASKESSDFGYKLIEDDCLFKIQGTCGLENVESTNGSEIRPCYFVSIYAIMLALHQPIYKWNYRNVDICIEKGKELIAEIGTKKLPSARTIQNLLVDNFVLDILVKPFEIDELGKRAPLMVALAKIIQTKMFFIIQFMGMSFAVYHDQYYHLFDPYPSLDTLDKTTDSKQPEKSCQQSVQTYKDKNTASWILFERDEAMLEYMKQKVKPPERKSDFKLYIINILSHKKATRRSRLVNVLTKPMESNLPALHSEEDKHIFPEEIKWLDLHPQYAPWSRIAATNLGNQQRGLPHSKWKEFDIEIPGNLYSLWGHIHPKASVFKEYAGKQYLAVNVIACCMANLYHLPDWNSTVIDSIVVYGDKYFRESISDIKQKNYEVSLEVLNTEYKMNHFNFKIHLESVAYGLLYNTTKNELNLSKALKYFFSYFQSGILQCFGKSLTFGRRGGHFFMFDCQSYGDPLFPVNQGSAYVLYCTTIQRLLQCIVITLNVKYHNIEFVLYNVDVDVQNEK